ncbi:30S ribosomal protein S18 [Candidatus Woesebacteria bacterium RIFCSPHIGHO2_01_FULL_39_32]|uniref:Small ribosomal subunit protein bS18 n=1 Tax=Candidatus Woesebacteria bacterium RIFCSPLOWO2_01_FULL_39_25 TaxID=1802521 RepID=A0A1F8BLG7_9BACT|nr:MAG: 30S ribosomal protein S18 [Candidatus Woesebacteria bacterium GWB1_37_5]OGM23919.1 MAG: 30S ribosomal protein S18 [Candidatus Woesebacteria bacterium RIFCSPHIGHO2_01_FULL_39_32]OGM37426.1 MAG: 30S ribosomal protein S18 [Candidatus Woesebacteria bacterium RIFCSPHIGHO2_12_FULL_38_11]OGM64108.1 MAG: 30S ribosomal protein S18 [Candidatus Woesebacteria bacterium RIFCSPLOWO2_01_FULL_39_25]
MPKRKAPPVTRFKTPENCPFCKMGKNPDYKDYKTLEKYLSDRAKILGRDRTGICTRHQKKLSTAIKRARYLGLLPFVPGM